MSSLLLTDCIDRFLSWTKANRRPNTVAHYRYQLNRFAAWANASRSAERPPRAPIQADEITPALLTTFGRSFHTIQAVQRLCRWLYREEKSLPMNPLHGMPKPKLGSRRRTLTAAESVRLLRSADPVFRRFLIVLRETICRPQEARALRWIDLTDDSAAAYFALPTAKGFGMRTEDLGERVIPVSPRLRRLLGRMSRAGVTLQSPVLTDSKGRAWTSNAVRCRFRRLRVRLGLVADRRGEKIVPYSFRHTGATAAVRAGVRDFRLMSALGHTSTRTTQRYYHPSPADVVDAMQCVWEFKSNKGTKKDRPGSR
jgi:integrase